MWGREVGKLLADGHGRDSTTSRKDIRFIPERTLLAILPEAKIVLILLLLIVGEVYNNGVSAILTFVGDVFGTNVYRR